MDRGSGETQAVEDIAQFPSDVAPFLRTEETADLQLLAVRAQVKNALIFIRLIEDNLQPIRLEAVGLARALGRYRFHHQAIAIEPQSLAAPVAFQMLAEEIDEEQPFGAAEAENRPGAHQPEGRAIGKADDAGDGDQNDQATRRQSAAGTGQGFSNPPVDFYVFRVFYLLGRRA